jgi:hypothetical protein
MRNALRCETASTLRAKCEAATRAIGAGLPSREASSRLARCGLASAVGASKRWVLPLSGRNGEKMDDGSDEEKEAKLAAFMHGGFDARIRSVFESTKREPTSLADPKVLSSAIADLYRAFGHRCLSEPFRHCECCVSDTMAAHWATDSLNSLSADDLWAVMSNVPATAGTADDVLYFTPRLLEHAAAEECVLDLSWAFSSLQRADSPPTTDAERKALRRYFEPIWLGLRDTDPHHSLGISSIVLPTAVLTREVSYYLDLWLGSPALQLYWNRSADAFWDKTSEAYRAVMRWLKEHQDQFR